MFAIAFLSREPEIQEEGWPALWGQITLGEYVERFLAPVDEWTPEQYQRQWWKAAERLLGGESAAFVTAPWQSWWAMWPEGENAIVQEHLLTPGRVAQLALGPALLAGGAHHQLVATRETCSDEGDRISEWQVRIDDVQQWLRSVLPASAAEQGAAGDVRPGIAPE